MNTSCTYKNQRKPNLFNALNLVLSYMNVALKLLLFAFAITCLLSCSKKNDITTNTEIIGTWQLTSDTLTSYENGKVSYTESSGPFKYTNNFQFNKNGTGAENRGQFIINFTYTLTGNQIVCNIPQQTVVNGGLIPSATIDGTATISGNILVIFSDDTFTSADGVIIENKETRKFTR